MKVLLTLHAAPLFLPKQEVKPASLPHSSLPHVCLRRSIFKILSSLSVFNSALQIFSGNQNHDTPELRLVAAVRTRFVRIYPERATAEGLGLRLELTGCDLDGECTSRAALRLAASSSRHLSTAKQAVSARAFPGLVPACSHKHSRAEERRTHEEIRFIYSFMYFFCQQELAKTFPHKV